MQLRGFRGASLAGKLTASFAAILALVAALSFSSWHVIGSLGNVVQTIAGTTARQAALVDAVSAGFQEMQDHAKGTQLAHAIRELERGSSGRACSACHQMSGKESDGAEFEAIGARVQQSIAALRPMLADARERTAADTMDRDLQQWVELYRRYLVEAYANHFEAAHGIITEQMLPLHQEIDHAAAELISADHARLDRSAADAASTAARNRWLTLGLIALAAMVIAGIVIALRRTSRSLGRISVSLGQRARQVAAMAGEVSAGSQAAAHGASEQAGSLHQVSTASSEINGMAHRNAEKAGTSAELSADFGRALGDATRRMGELLTAMRGIQGASEKVAHIARLIDDIAFQTNILSLNAAVEAARAGESGLGFAVVAGEVRNLAQRSAQAARETGTLIDEAIAAARNGVSRLDDVSTAFRSLNEGAARVTALAGEVRAGSLQQVEQVEQIARRIGEIQRLTDSASSGALQGAHAGDSLSEEASRLAGLVSSLVSLVDGSRSGAA